MVQHSVWQLLAGFWEEAALLLVHDTHYPGSLEQGLEVE